MAHSWYSNPAARTWLTAALTVDAREFHQSLPGYAPTPLVDLPALAAELDVAHVLVKVEGARLGLPAFKILGASYSIARALSTRLGSDETLPLAKLAGSFDGHILAATDGNHGRAVAHVARLLGVRARIFVPDTITTAAQEAIEREGAELTVFEQPYDDVVRRAAAEAERAGDAVILVQDSSWPGYQDIPGWIVDGYSTLFREIDEQLAEQGLPPASLVTAPTGVGALAEAALHHYRRGATNPTVLIVEPDTAACVIESLHAGERVDVLTGNTIMNGLNCGVVSPGSWPTMRDGADAAVTVTDEAATLAVRDLRALGIDAGPCGASSLAAVRAVHGNSAWRSEVGMTESSVLVLLCTEAFEANPIPL